MGTAAIVLGTIGYWATLKELQRVELFRLGRPVLVISLVIVVAGVLLLVGIAAACCEPP